MAALAAPVAGVDQTEQQAIHNQVAGASTAGDHNGPPSTPVPLVWQGRAAAEPASQQPEAAGLAATAQPAGQVTGKQVLTSFGQMLRYALLPCRHISEQASSSICAQQQPCLLPGQQLLLPDDDMLAVFRGFTLPYLDAPVQHQQLLDVLQVSSHLSVELVVDVLVCQATGMPFGQQASVAHQHPEQQQLQQEDPTVVSSCQLMVLPYSYLQQQLDAAQSQASTANRSNGGDSRRYRKPDGVTGCQYKHLQHLVVSAFQQHPLMWLPDTPGSTAATRPGSSSKGLSAGVCAGRFYRLNELCLRDPSGVLENLAVSKHSTKTMHKEGDAGTEQATAATAAETSPPCIPRSVLLQYASLHQLFSQHMAVQPAAAVATEGGDVQAAAAIEGAGPVVAAEPSLKQYIAALQLLAADAADRALAEGHASVRSAHNQETWMQVRAMLLV